MPAEPTAPEQIEVRPAAADEFAAVGDLTLAAYLADDLLAADPEAAAYAEELRDAGRRASHADLLVAVRGGGELLGTVTFCLPGTEYAELAGPGEAEFRMLAVAPGGRRRGVGRALVLACLDRARAAGARSVVISSLASMTAAHALYEQLGFRREPARDWRPLPAVELLAYVLDPLTPPS